MEDGSGVSADPDRVMDRIRKHVCDPGDICGHTADKKFCPYFSRGLGRMSRDVVLLMKKEGDVANYFRLTRNENVLVSREGTKDESMAKNKQELDCEKVAKLAFNSAVAHKLKQGYKEVSRTTRVLDPTEGNKASGSDDDEKQKSANSKKMDVPISKVSGHIFKYDDTTKDTAKDKGVESDGETEDMTACKYGSDCIRKNPEHFKQFSHPKGFKIPATKHVKKIADTGGSPKKKAKLDSKKTKGKGTQVFSGMSICLTGGLPGLVRKEAQALIVKYGGKACNGISKNVTHVVASDPSAGSSKLQKAEDLGIEVVDDSWFMDLLGEAGYGKE